MNKKDNLSEAIINRKEHYDELVNHMPFKDKVQWAKIKIKEFLNFCSKNKEIKEITVSFSGGKDSTVLLDLVMKVHHEIKCKIPIVMVYATEITFPSTYKFIKHINKIYMDKYPQELKNIQIVNPKKTWDEILTTKGYPIYSKQVSLLLNRVKRSNQKTNLCKWFFGIDKEKTSTARYKLSYKRLFLLDDNIINKWPKIDNELRNYFKKYNEPYFFSEKCCDFIKGNLKHDKRPSFIGTMAEESQMRKRSWINLGCNIFSKAPKSRPLSIWKTQDIWKYIKQNNLEINEAYGFDINKSLEEQNLRFTRLGCTSCPYGSSIEQKLIEKLKNKETKLNRFEILYKDWPNLYKAQIINNGMYKILIDMGIKINLDKNYMTLYDKRHKQINDWYSSKNIKKNIISIMTQIESYSWTLKNNKAWTYSLDDYKQAMNFFDDIKDKKINIQTIEKERNKIRRKLKIKI